jgi:hypothetical protein
MTTTTFDTLGYFEKLKAAGVPEAQAKVQVEVMQDVIKGYDAASRQELATKGDIQDVRNEIQDVRNEIQDVRNEIQNTKHEILKWVIGVAIGQAALIIAVMALMK